jgi:DNA-binding NarL/FixJ family response regulator
LAGAHRHRHFFLTVDDHQLLLEGIAAVLEGQPDMVLIAQASSGREAIEGFREHRPDVTLMDLRMPDIVKDCAVRKRELPLTLGLDLSA